MARRILSVAAVLILSVVGCTKGSREYTSVEGRFVVMLPGTPSLDPDPDVPEGVQQVRLAQQSGTYTVAWQDLPKKEADRDPEERLDRACNGALRALEATQVSRKPVRLDGQYPGRELVAGWEGREGRVRARFYLVDGRLYQVVVNGPRWWAESATADRFLESFGLTGR
jgi:hypothetical protein